MIKLSTGNAELSPLETIQAETFAEQLLLRAANTNISHESGLISGVALQRQVGCISQNINRFPGIAPFLAERLEILGDEALLANAVYSGILEAIEETKLGQP